MKLQQLSGAAGERGGHLNQAHCKQRGPIMFQAKFLLTAGALAMLALIAGGTGSAKAAQISFGNTAQPSPNTCVNGSSGSEGQLCGQNLTFAAGANSFVANGYNGNEFTTNPTATLTYTTLKSNMGTDESGLGENDNAPVMGDNCTDATMCETLGGRSVEVSSNAPITDVVIGSVQSASSDVFDLYGYNGTSWVSIDSNQTQNGGTVTGATPCSAIFDSASDTCYYNNLPGYSAIGLYDVTGDTLLTAVSYNATPAPIIGQGLPVVLAVGGLLFGARLWQRNKTRRSLGAAMPHAAA